MDAVAQFIIKDPQMATIVGMVIFGLGALHIAYLVISRFGFLGNKHPTMSDVMSSINKLGTNHLHGLPDMERKLDRIEIKLDKISEQQADFGERIVRVETLLDVGIK